MGRGVYSCASGFKHIFCPPLSRQVQYFDLKTLTLTLAELQTMSKTRQKWRREKRIQWVAEESGWLNELQYQSRRDSARNPSMRLQSTAFLTGSAYCSVSPPVLFQSVKSWGKLALPRGPYECCNSQVWGGGGHTVGQEQQCQNCPRLRGLWITTHGKCCQAPWGCSCCSWTLWQILGNSGGSRELCKTHRGVGCWLLVKGLSCCFLR